MLGRFSDTQVTNQMGAGLMNASTARATSVHGRTVELEHSPVIDSFNMLFLFARSEVEMKLRSSPFQKSPLS